MDVMIERRLRGGPLYLIFFLISLVFRQSSVCNQQSHPQKC